MEFYFWSKKSQKFYVKLRWGFNKVSMSLLKKCVCFSRHVNYRYANWRSWRYRWLVLLYVNQCWWTWRHHWSNHIAKSQFRWNCSKVTFSKSLELKLDWSPRDFWFFIFQPKNLKHRRVNFEKKEIDRELPKFNLIMNFKIFALKLLQFEN